MMHIESGKCPGISIEKYRASRNIKAESTIAAQLKSRESSLPTEQMQKLSVADGASSTPDLLDQGPEDEDGGVQLTDGPVNTLAAAGLDSEENTESRQITNGSHDNDDLMSFHDTIAPSEPNWEKDSWTDAGGWEPATTSTTSSQNGNGSVASSSTVTVQSPALAKEGVQQKMTWGTSATPPSAPAGWDPSRFYNSQLKKYVCACDKGFPTLQGFEAHIKSGVHSAGVFRYALSPHSVCTTPYANKTSLPRCRCPVCLRLFKSVTALVSHCENTSSRCQINRGSSYSKLMADISAGLLETKGSLIDGTPRYSTSSQAFDLANVKW